MIVSSSSSGIGFAGQPLVPRRARQPKHLGTDKVVVAARASEHFLGRISSLASVRRSFLANSSRPSRPSPWARGRISSLRRSPERLDGRTSRRLDLVHVLGDLGVASSAACRSASARPWSIRSATPSSCARATCAWSVDTGRASKPVKPVRGRRQECGQSAQAADECRATVLATAQSRARAAKRDRYRRCAPGPARPS